MKFFLPLAIALLALAACTKQHCASCTQQVTENGSSFETSCTEFCGTEDEIKDHEAANTRTLQAISGPVETTMTCTY